MSKQITTPVKYYLNVEELIASRPPHVRMGIQSIGVAAEYFERYKNFKVQMHSPALVLFSFILRGHCWHIMGDEAYEETGGSVGITHYGQYHDILTDEGGIDVINLYLDLTRCPLPRLPHDLETILPAILPADPCLQNHLNHRIRLVFDQPEAVARKLISIEQELKEQEPGYQETILLYFNLFMIDCCRQALRSGITSQFRQARPRDARLEGLRCYLDSHFADPLTLSSLAQQVGITPEYLCRAFKDYTGKSVFDYILNRRIQEAMKRLRSGDDKVSIIAMECGFNDLSYFSRKFKATVGRSPAAYRHYTPWFKRGHDSTDDPACAPAPPDCPSPSPSPNPSPSPSPNQLHTGG